jgi:hypothetical protein
MHVNLPEIIELTCVQARTRAPQTVRLPALTVHNWIVTIRAELMPTYTAAERITAEATRHLARR